MNKLIKIGNVHIAVNQIVSVRLAEILGAKHDECMAKLIILTTSGVEYSSDFFYRDDSWDDGGVREMERKYEALLRNIERRLSE